MIGADVLSMISGTPSCRPIAATSPIGNTVAEFFDALVHSRSGIRQLPDDLQAAGSDLVAGLVSFDAAAHWPPHQSAQFDRATQFALVAARQALSDAAFSPSGEEAFSSAAIASANPESCHRRYRPTPARGLS